jgi:hypothetical protein
VQFYHDTLPALRGRIVRMAQTVHLRANPRLHVPGKTVTMRIMWLVPGTTT